LFLSLGHIVIPTSIDPTTLLRDGSIGPGQVFAQANRLRRGLLSGCCCAQEEEEEEEGFGSGNGAEEQGVSNTVI
jgi:hypothetical protein